MMAGSTKDGRRRKLPNRLQNPHLPRYTLLTVKYTVYSTKGKTMTRIGSKGFDVKLRHETFFYSFRVSRTFLKGKKQFLDGQNAWNYLGDAFSQFRIVNQTYLRTKISYKIFHVIYTVTLKIGKTLRLQESINKSDHLLLCLLFP